MRTRHDLGTPLDALGRDDVAAFAVLVQHQRDVGAAVRVVLETLDLAWNTVLVAQEIDYAIMTLVRTAAVTYANTAGVVAAVDLGLLFEQRRVRLAPVQIPVDHLDQRTAAVGCRFYLDDCHMNIFPSGLFGFDAGEINVLTGLEAHIRLFPIRTTTRRLAGFLFLSFDVGHGDRLDLDIEHLFHGLLDHRLAGVAPHPEYDLAVLFGHARALFRNMRAQDTLIEFVRS